MAPEPKAMQEIHQIRLRLYRKKRRLRAGVKVRRTNQIGHRLMKELGLGQAHRPLRQTA